MRYCLNYSGTTGFCPLKCKTKIAQFSDDFRLDTLFLRHMDPSLKVVMSCRTVCFLLFFNTLNPNN